MIWEQNEGSELVVVLTMVQVEVATEVMDVIEVKKERVSEAKHFKKSLCKKLLRKLVI